MGSLFPSLPQTHYVAPGKSLNTCISPELFCPVRMLIGLAAVLGSFISVYKSETGNVRLELLFKPSIPSDGAEMSKEMQRNLQKIGETRKKSFPPEH